MFGNYVSYLRRLVLARESISNFRRKHGADAEKGGAALRMADLIANERNLLQQQNEELKRLNEALRENGSKLSSRLEQPGMYLGYL